MIRLTQYLFVFIFLSGSYGIQAQLYRNYNLNNGLAGNNVYCAVEDNDGFIWFGTETGLSRFDGTHFKNFTVTDGLPDNEIIAMAVDQDGRIWIAPFKNEICYYYKGKFYNKENDSLLNNLKLESFSNSIVINFTNEVIIQNKNFIAIINLKNSTVKKLSIEKIPGFQTFSKVSVNKSGSVWLTTSFTIYELKNSELKKIYTMPPEHYKSSFYGNIFITDESHIIRFGSRTRRHQYIFLETLNKYSPIKHPFEFYNFKSLLKKDSLLYCSSLEGCKVYNINQLNSRPVATYLDNININRVFITKSNDKWFLTATKGVYYENNSTIHILSNESLGNKTSIISSIYSDNQNVYIGNTGFGYLIIKRDDLKSGSLQKWTPHFLMGQEANHTVTSIFPVTNKGQFISSSHGVSVTSQPEIATSTNVKYAELLANEILVGTDKYIIVINKKTLKITDTIWTGRTTCATKINGDYYVGTTSGLYKITGKIRSVYMGDSMPVFKRRISGIRFSADGTMLVSTYDMGVIAYKAGKVVAHITTANGLASNICRTMFLQDSCLWVGTDKGLNKICVLADSHKVMKTYSTEDGLASNMINVLFGDSKYIYAGTSEGLCYFEDKKTEKTSNCHLRILGITVSGKERYYDSTLFTLETFNNNIRFDFVGLSYRSGGQILYKYRLIGLSNKYEITNANYVSYPILEPGKYSFEITATDKFGNLSETVAINFAIKKKFTETNWFRLLLLTLILSCFFLYVKWRIYKIKREVAEKDFIRQKMNEQEQSALKSQMNPHFIFNCLNSIQDYVITADIKGANKFIGNFAKLIRKTLDNSAKPYISIEEEEGYLNTYLDLEQQRFNHMFEYSITADSNINKAETYIAPMLLQPYVENAIRHGIKNKQDGKGKISVEFYLKNKALICAVTDNGVGRMKAEELKGDINIEYQSKGMQLTSKRIDSINLTKEQEIEVRVIDLYNQENQPCGTQVELKILQKNELYYSR